MINDSPTGTVSGGLGVTQALTNGPINIQTGSQLLDVLWYQNPVSVNVINNPVGAGTQTGLVNGVETVKVDPSICPGAPDGTLPGGIQQSNASPNINELAERIGHELVHAEVPNFGSINSIADLTSSAFYMTEAAYL